MTTPAKQKPCGCDAFQTALRDRFVEQIGDELFLSSLETGPQFGAFRSMTYGPKISFCPFCGASLSAPRAELPQARAT